MGQTGEFDHLAAKQGLVAGEFIDHQRALPVPEELRHILPTPAGLVVEDDDRRVACQGIAAISPEIGPLGLSIARIELLHRGFIGMQHRALAEQFGEAQPERFQGDADATHPVGQGGARQGHPRAGGLPLETVERQMIDVLADHHPGQQGRRCQTAVDDRSDGRCSGKGFAGPAGVLRVDVALDEKLGGDDAELLGHVLADPHQRLTTLPTGAGFGLLQVLDTRQLLGQGLTAGAVAFGFLGGREMRPHLGRLALFGQAGRRPGRQRGFRRRGPVRRRPGTRS
jgi:hypothetical protein